MTIKEYIKNLKDRIKFENDSIKKSDECAKKNFYNQVDVKTRFKEEMK